LGADFVLQVYQALDVIKPPEAAAPELVRLGESPFLNPSIPI